MSAAPEDEHHGLGHAVPIFRVRDLDAALEYYVRVLGFAVEFVDKGFAGVRRDRLTLFLCQGDQSAPGAWAWTNVDDVERLHEELRSRGARIRNPPTNYHWAYEMQVADLDGNVIRIGTEPKDAPTDREWLDADGVRWVRDAEDKWVRADGR